MVKMINVYRWKYTINRLNKINRSRKMKRAAMGEKSFRGAVGFMPSHPKDEPTCFQIDQTEPATRVSKGM